MTDDLEMKRQKTNAEESYYAASQWQLMWRKFKKHKLAIGGTIVLSVFYVIAIFAEFVAPYDMVKRTDYRYYPPTRVHFFDKEGQFHLRPFVYEIERKLDLETFSATFVEDKTENYPIYFFVPGEKYKLWSLFEADLHLFGTKGTTKIFLFGTERLGRGLFSRVVYGSRVSLSIGLIGVFLSLVLGIIVGGVSGYYGGAADTIAQRVIELLKCIPTIPLWMSLSAFIPRDWSMIKTYFAITIVLSFVGWTTLARVVRGKLMSLREEDFAMAAKVSGLNDWQIIIKHLIPSSLSYLLVSLTLAIPYMILGETALSFLGLGIQPPAVSWGTLLQDAQRVTVLANYPWILGPGIFVVVVVLAFNFLGDGLRDAADPYR